MGRTGTADPEPKTQRNNPSDSPWRAHHQVAGSRSDLPEACERTPSLSRVWTLPRHYLKTDPERLVPTFCINSTRGRGGHESPRWIRALGKGDGRTNRDLWSHPSEHCFRLLLCRLCTDCFRDVCFLGYLCIVYWDCGWVLCGNRRPTVAKKVGGRPQCILDTRD